jgi:hypothetical protein
MCHADQQWTGVLPLVLLGICTAFKEDLQASVAKLVHGEPLRIPGELLTPTGNPVDPAHIISELWQHVTPPRLHLCTATSRNAPTSSSVRTQRVGLWSPRTAVLTKSCHGERRHCDSSCAEGPSLCQPSGPSRSTFSMGLTAGTAFSIRRSAQPRPQRHLPRCHSPLYELRAPVATSISPLASTSEQPSSRWW